MTILGVALYVLNLGYGFEGSGKRLGEYTFISHTLTGVERPLQGGNRFTDTWLGKIRVPVPEQYLRGMDVQKFDFEQGKWSYLRGEQKRGGWWWYYLYALGIKTPLGTIALLMLAAVVPCHRHEAGKFKPWINDVVLLAPAIAVLVLVSSQVGFSRYLRYAVPALPFFYIFAARTAVLISHQRRRLCGFVLLALAASVGESFAVFPHSMSFFNVLVGGPRNGHAHLVDSNIDWGQDLLFLRDWYEAHPEARPLCVAYFGPIGMKPEYAGIEGQPVPKCDPGFAGHFQLDEAAGPQPGWFAVSVNYLRGYRHYDNNRPCYTYFLLLKPVAMAGYSIYIYHLTVDDVNRLREEMGLPLLPTRESAA